jgi:ferredoxin
MKLAIACVLSGLVATGYAYSPECTAHITSYPGYSGTYASTVRGTVRVIADGNSNLAGEGFNKKITLEYNIAGSEPSVNEGLHIHKGTTCEDADYVAGHYYATSEDPWTNSNGAYMSTDSSGAMSSSFEIKDGISYAAMVGHAIILHDGSGTRIGCGICIESCTASIKKYPDYEATNETVDYEAEGTITITGYNNTYDATLGLSYNLKGLGVSSSAGLSINLGTTCEKADYVGGDYYTLSTDPWTSLSLATDTDGKATGSFAIQAGLTYGSIVGHAVVVKAPDANATEIGCGICISNSYQGGDSSSMLADWAWILVVIVCALGCGAIGFGVAYGLARTNPSGSLNSSADHGKERSGNASSNRDEAPPQVGDWQGV